MVAPKGLIFGQAFRSYPLNSDRNRTQRVEKILVNQTVL